MGSQRVGHALATERACICIHSSMIKARKWFTPDSGQSLGAGEERGVMGCHEGNTGAQLLNSNFWDSSKVLFHN